ncbi:hypothetical protein EJ04DRAFT_213197 [Polyplosphaeria fusca]|uniref:Uncharacterized protein n=1 Tax=Polyplosphaeria fusca TaxID=682080 RepID=A0A9P4R7W0_9PLEO|nr:hypothetical protein EJ04DRAFT_213197 [Polyplosphaeria fusca]
MKAVMRKRKRVSNRKIWPAKFKTRAPDDPDREGSWIESKASLNACDEGLEDLFLRDWHSSVPDCIYEDIKELCEASDDYQSETRQNVDDYYGNANARLDDRKFDPDSDPKFGSKVSRVYEKRLTASMLKDHLGLPRQETKNLSRVDRRILYIANLDASYIRALAATATYPQAAVLREAIWNHVTLQTALKVKVPPKGYPIFRLEFHMPYLALRETVTPLLNKLKSRSRRRLPRRWTPLEFLDIRTKHRPNECVYGIHEAQISIVVYGSDHSRWTAYGFSDTEFNDFSCKKPEDDDSGENSEDESDDDEYSEDPIAADCDDGEAVVESNQPIGDPREYFLTMVDHRMKRVWLEWMEIIRQIEKSADKVETDYSFILDGSRNTDASLIHAKKAFDLITQLKGLLRRVQDCFVKMQYVLDDFFARDGDVRYFADISRPVARLPLHNIQMTCRELKHVGRRLKSLHQNCEMSYDILVLRLNVKSVQLASESQLINHKAYGLNLESSKVNAANHDISLETSKVVLAAHKIAQVTFSMNQVWIPFGIAVAYFGTQNEIFRFDRNSTSFLLFFLITIVIINAWIYLQRLIVFWAGSSKLLRRVSASIAAYRLTPRALNYRDWRQDHICLSRATSLDGI